MTSSYDHLLHSKITDKIIAGAYRVFNKLGAGFMEKVYENALVVELSKQGLKVLQQYPIRVYYDESLVGEYYADLYVEDKVIVELKAVIELSRVHETQLVNYLKATKTKVGLLINFGETITIKRKVM